MSFEIFIGTFEDEELRHLPVKTVRERFAPLIASEKKGWWQLKFDEGPTGAEVHVGEGRLTDSFKVKRPPPYLSFWKIIAGILKDFPCVLYWPGGGAVMASLDLLPHLPKSFVEAMGIPWVTTDPERIRRYVGENS